jgi:hypothetical protein
VVGCSDEVLGSACTGRLQAPLVHASKQEEYLGLGSEQLAIVQVTDGSGVGGPLCTGAFVTSEWLITGAHCLQIESPVVTVKGERSARAVVESAVHSFLDVALLKVAATASADQPLRAIPLAAADELEVVVGSVVELAGYGLSEEGDLRELRFLAEPIVEIDEHSVLVDGFGASGACLGDSGGPLLVRARSGPARVAGVLTSGSASCLNRDRYVRLDALTEWTSGIVGSPAPSDVTCGGISEEGRCLYGSAMFCHQGKLVAEPCAEGTGCGWDRDRRGFRCVVPEEDPCSGVDSVGACFEGQPRRCNAGTLEGKACECGEVCGIDGRTGGPRCRKPETPAMN